MRQLGWALSVTGLMLIGLQGAEAGVTCKIVPGWCPAHDNNSNVNTAGGKPTSVPEPATLMLLGAGVSAVGAAALRRRKQK